MVLDASVAVSAHFSTMEADMQDLIRNHRTIVITAIAVLVAAVIVLLVVYSGGGGHGGGIY